MKLFFTFFLLILPLNAFAQSRCSGQTQVDLNFCAKEKWAVADQELNRLWKVVKPKEDARGRGNSLLNKQRAWLQQRDVRCESELAKYAGGSAAAMFYWVCMEEQTLKRNKALRGYL